MSLIVVVTNTESFSWALHCSNSKYLGSTWLFVRQRWCLWFWSTGSWAKAIHWASPISWKVRCLLAYTHIICSDPCPHSWRIIWLMWEYSVLRTKRRKVVPVMGGSSPCSISWKLSVGNIAVLLAAASSALPRSKDGTWSSFNHQNYVGGAMLGSHPIHQ
jgi:hypothetical protein